MLSQLLNSMSTKVQLLKQPSPSDTILDKLILSKAKQHEKHSFLSSLKFLE